MPQRTEPPAPGRPHRRVLVVTAVAAERDAVRSAVAPSGQALVVDVVDAGVGPAAAAAGAATALARAPYDLAVSAGIGGGFAQLAAIGAAVVASRIVAADLGAETPAGFLDVAQLGFGTTEHRPPPALAQEVAAVAGAVLGPVLTVATATGTAERATQLAARHPGAVAEAMEGFGVAEAAARHGVPVLEIRTVSNTVGPRDRTAWRIPQALQALTDAFTKVLPVLASVPVLDSVPVLGWRAHGDR